MQNDEVVAEYYFDKPIALAAGAEIGLVLEKEVTIDLKFYYLGSPTYTMSYMDPNMELVELEINQPAAVACLKVGMLL